jgi:hypothetical protein
LVIWAQFFVRLFSVISWIVEKSSNVGKKIPAIAGIDSDDATAWSNYGKYFPFV